jgi:uncharacterized protein YecT (DUF1311 family)
VKAASAEDAAVAARKAQQKLRAQRLEAHAAPNHSTDNAPALAEDRPSSHGSAGYSAEYAACMASAGGFTEATAHCNSSEFARQGLRMDRAFNAALATRTGAQRTRLVEAQRTWTKLRDDRCQDGGGDGSLLHEGSCRLDMTIRRAVELEHAAG